MSVHPELLAATIPDAITFAIAAVISVAGALGVVLSRNPVHSALMLVMTLFGVAVLFVEENAQFLAAVQVIVYAGAIVVLFLFVIMLLGVDQPEALAAEPLRGQRSAALAVGVLALVEVILLARGRWPVGPAHLAGRLNGTGKANVEILGKSIFTTYLLPFEITSALLVIAVIGAVVLARRPRPPDGGEGNGLAPSGDGAFDGDFDGAFDGAGGEAPLTGPVSGPRDAGGSGDAGGVGGPTGSGGSGYGTELRAVTSDERSDE
ncbi:MAG: NADH-quinone oxidoreductase subunit J family protein [Acidimicrobiales bacterium]